MALELQCYRKGCGKTYISNENSADACRYHPGEPVFHDALKSWSCCEKKSTDFSVFLDMPGCTYGLHSNERPPPAPKVEKKTLAKEIIIRGPPPKTQGRSERPDIDEPLVALKSTIGATLKMALEKRLASVKPESKESADKGTDGIIQVGTACKNNSCRAHYEGPHSNDEECLYHPGIPVFHEGLKYWSCCNKKTTEFDKFLEQIGCESGNHKWVAAKDGSKQANCRMDWHQTGGNVIISVFAKCADPTKTVVKANRVSINILVVFEEEKIFSQTFELNGVIDTSKSNIKLLGAKVEITLKKAEPESWAQLKYKAPASETGESK